MHPQLEELALLAPGLVERLGAVAGVVGVALGGSRARGTHLPESDVDLGIYYCDGLDVAAIQRLADEYSDTPVAVTAPGGWGPWVDGGGWLVVGDVHVDFIYRNVDRVAAVWADCQQGRYINAIQAGHPLGFWSHAYAGELALGVPASPWTSELSRLRNEMSVYPEPLSLALIAGLWEASFSIANARKAAASLDVVYVAGCLFRAAGVTAHALHGHAHRWLVNEKGGIASAGRLPAAPAQFVERVAQSFSSLRANETALVEACGLLQSVVDDAATALTL